MRGPKGACGYFDDERQRTPPSRGSPGEGINTTWSAPYLSSGQRAAEISPLLCHGIREREQREVPYAMAHKWTDPRSPEGPSRNRKRETQLLLPVDLPGLSLACCPPYPTPSGHRAPPPCYSLLPSRHSACPPAWPQSGPMASRTKSKQGCVFLAWV